MVDKAYDAESLRSWFASARIRAVIASTAARKTPCPSDRTRHRRRNVIERLFCALKNWRGVATRYDCLAQNCLSAITLAAITSAWISMSPIPTFCPSPDHKQKQHTNHHCKI
jgi:transposase